ncbi:MAG: O-antigen ligase family protein [Syntrophorhabdales bacterium]
MSGIVPGIIAIYGFVFSTRILELPPELQSAGVFRVNGTFPNTSDLAIYMALIIPTQVFPVITRMRKTTAIRMDAMFLYFACAISVVSLILTFTRAPFLVLLLTLGLLMAFQSTTSKVKTIFLGLMLASLVAVLIPYSASEMARVGENTVASRLINWHLAFSNISSGSLFIGRGLESFRSISFGGQVHNDYLKLLLETGIIGLSLYLMVIFKELVPQLKLFFRLRKDVSDADFVISSSLVACFIEYILLSAFDPLFCAGPFATIFWILAGCSRAFVNQCPKNKVK